MKRQTARHSSLFLFEIIIALFFFCVASMLCLRLFSKAHIIAQETRDLDMAVNQSTSIAELFQGEEYPLTHLQSIYPHSKLTKSGETLTLFYDAEWNPCSEMRSSYRIQVDIAAQSPLLLGTIKAETLDGHTIYSLETNSIPKGGEGL